MRIQGERLTVYQQPNDLRSLAGALNSADPPGPPLQQSTSARAGWPAPAARQVHRIVRRPARGTYTSSRMPDLRPAS